MFSNICILIVLLTTVLTATPSWGAAPRVVPIPHRTENVDSLETHVTERNKRLYDSLEVKSKRKAVPRLLYKLLFVEPHLDTLKGQIVDESRILKPYEGMTIGEITIDRHNVFSSDSTWLTRSANKVHVVTRERIIRRDLLYKEGDKFNPELVVRSQQLLKSRSYIYDTDLQITRDTLDSTKVNICVRTRDSWTISVDVGIHSDSHTMVGLSDGNILGTGNTFRFQTNFSRKDFSYGGNAFEYEVPNVFGSFFKANMEVGRRFYEDRLHMEVSKDFLKPSDYEVGFSYKDMRSKYYMIDLDTNKLVKVRNLDVWAGRSHYLPSINSSIFYTMRYNYARFSERPFVYEGYNPALHDHDVLLAGFGIYREKLYAANMIFGFGSKEYFASGYKAELLTGYSWGEFEDGIYLGMSCKTGKFSTMGYMMANFNLGSYINPRSGRWSRSAVDVDLAWFSHLFYFRRNRVRQFLALHYTQGWNRELGSNESIRFTPPNTMQALKQHAQGTNRMVLNTQTVIFTPFQPWGFRFAFFGFADFGLLGYSSNIFKNPFFNTLGMGLRIKNERLIFSEIEIRLGIAFGKGGLLESDYFRVASGSNFPELRYRPERPEIVDFK